MARRRSASANPIVPDPLYNNVVVSRIISTVMKCGKKSLAQRVVYGAIEQANVGHADAAADPLDLLNKAIENVRPRVEVKARRVGGATYQVPLEVTPERGTSLAVRWIVGFASKRKGVTMQRALAGEIKDAANKAGAAVKKRDDVHKMAQANKAFAHFRW
jgi:small subunit ribosomal protein S7